ncbi:MAG TPA: carbon storage regulator CsrA [Pyrinomonadaceae bacterium]|nr:carbon storage regulator CsrA [Pyrinomonadaceae bacterium]
MLVLTRRAGEKIVIGNEIVIEVISVSGEGVRLGITAPRETSVHRYEVFAEIQEANRAAEAVLNELGESALENLSAIVRKQKE